MKPKELHMKEVSDQLGGADPRRGQWKIYPQIVQAKNYPDVEVELKSKNYSPLWQRGKPWDKKTPGTH